ITPSINFNSNIKINNALYISSILNISNIQYTIAGIEENITAKFSDVNVTLSLQTFGNFMYYYFNDFTTSIDNTTFISNNRVIDADIMPFSLHGNDTYYFANTIYYNDDEKPGFLALNSTGGLKFYWKDENDKLNEIFDCSCTFGQFGMYYFI